MKSHATVRIDYENFGREYKFFISDSELMGAIDKMTGREFALFQHLSRDGSTVAEQLLALAMIAKMLYIPTDEYDLAITVK